MTDHKFRILARCDDRKTLTSRELRGALVGASARVRARLLQWMADTGIEVREPLSMTALRGGVVPAVDEGPR